MHGHQRGLQILVAFASIACCAVSQAQLPTSPPPGGFAAPVAPPGAMQPNGPVYVTPPPPVVMENLPPQVNPAPIIGEAGPAPAIGFDPALLSRGEAAFKRTCVQCHDAEKSLAKTKSLAAWLTTVRRMEEKQGAEVAAGDVEPIAIYLTAHGAAQAGAAAPLDCPPPPVVSNFAVYGTASPLWRGGDNLIQNPGFFPGMWLGVSYNDPNSPVSARATSCVACHADGPIGDRIELVEAVVRLDLIKATGCTRPELKAAVEAGRFIVPFGAFASQSNPGVYRTVSRPLIFNMGQRVLSGAVSQPVLPMPYSDEGAVVSFATPMFGDVVASADAYVVNGLQGNSDGVNFYLSRDYVDNNSRPAGGGRLTIGNQYLRFGASAMGGRHSPTAFGGRRNRNLDYSIYGLDATFHYDDLLRVQFEYAIRSTDRFNRFGNRGIVSEHVAGYYVEAELLLTAGVSVLARFDSQSYNALDTGWWDVARITYGFNFTLVGGSLLMINQEHWLLPGDLRPIDVTGARWAYTF